MPRLLPLQPAVAFARQSTTLSDRTVIYEARWNARAESWFLDLYDEEEEPIALGLRIVLGTPLGRRSVSPRRLPGFLIAEDLSGARREATFDDLGTRVVVYYFSGAELAEMAA
jgi:hypothetical protein